MTKTLQELKKEYVEAHKSEYKAFEEMEEIENECIKKFDIWGKALDRHSSVSSKYSDVLQKQLKDNNASNTNNSNNKSTYKKYYEECIKKNKRLSELLNEIPLLEKRIKELKEKINDHAIRWGFLDCYDIEVLEKAKREYKKASLEKSLILSTDKDIIDARALYEEELKND